MREYQAASTAHIEVIRELTYPYLSGFQHAQRGDNDMSVWFVYRRRVIVVRDRNLYVDSNTKYNVAHTV